MEQFNIVGTTFGKTTLVNINDEGKKVIFFGEKNFTRCSELLTYLVDCGLYHIANNSDGNLYVLKGIFGIRINSPKLFNTENGDGYFVYSKMDAISEEIIAARQKMCDFLSSHNFQEIDIAHYSVIYP